MFGELNSNSNSTQTNPRPPSFLGDDMGGGTARTGTMRVDSKLADAILHEDRSGSSTGPSVFGGLTQKLPNTESCVGVRLR